jgi:hypothetical protein
MLLDLEQLVASLDIPSTTNPIANQSPSPCNELLDEWDLWLQCKYELASQLILYFTGSSDTQPDEFLRNCEI